MSEEKIIFQPILTQKEWEDVGMPSYGAYRSLKRAMEDYPNYLIQALFEYDIEEPLYFD